MLVAAAALDALRGEDDPPSPAAVPPALRGELVWSDRGCRRHGVRLPDLAGREYRTIGCGVFSRRDNLGVRGGEVAWFAFPGARTTLLTAGALQHQVGSHFRVRDVAWLHGVRFAAILSGPRELLTIWEGQNLIRVLAPDMRGYDELRASPNGGYFAAVDADGGPVLVHDREGTRVPAPDGRAISWSPRERWAAIATGDAIVVVRAGSGDEVARIPVAALDVDWRGTADRKMQP